jgi:hypothetical protein
MHASIACLFLYEDYVRVSLGDAMKAKRTGGQANQRHCQWTHYYYSTEQERRHSPLTLETGKGLAVDRSRAQPHYRRFLIQLAHDSDQWLIQGTMLDHYHIIYVFLC